LGRRGRGRRDGRATGGRGIGHGEAAPVMASRWLRVFPAAWWALAGWSARSPVGYGPSGCGGRRPGPLGAGSGEEYSGRSRRWRCPCAASVAPPPLFSSVEPPPSASTESCEHDQRPDGSTPPATRKRVVLLPHAPDRGPDTRPAAAAPEGPQA
jgi:hypothetical protein